MVKLQNEFNVRIEWRGFELHPETPQGGRSIDSFLGKRRAEFENYLTRFAANFDVTIGTPSRVPNTRRALAMTEYARDEDKLTEFRDAIMNAHWIEGKSIEDDSALEQIADSIGLNGNLAIQAADAPKYLSRVDALREEAKQNRITSIPTFVFADQFVVGCQPFRVIEQRALAAGFTKSK